MRNRGLFFLALTAVLSSTSGCVHERVLCSDRPTAPGCEREDAAPDSAADTNVADAADTTEDAGAVRWHLHGRDSRV